VGLRTSQKFAKFLSFFVYYVIPIRKQTVFENLKIAFPDWDDLKIKEVAFNSYRSFIITFCESMVYMTISKENLLKTAATDYFELINSKINEGKGIIFLSGHFGNWEISAMWMALKISRPLNVLAKPQRNPYVTNFMTTMRERFGNKEIHLGISVKELLKKIYNKEIIGIVGDQRGAEDSFRVKLFGRDTAINSGAAALALRTGAPILFGLAIRMPGNNYKMFFEEIEYKKFTGNKEEIIQKITQEYMNLLEKYIRQYPEQWFWMHKIWKY